MIVVVGGIKGGSGKTTVATNLAVIRSRAGNKVLLVDADEQHSASDWAQQRALREVEDSITESITTVQLSGKALNVQLEKMGADYDEVIIDVGGRDTTSQRSALVIADLLIVPFKPRSLDIWTLGQVKVMINEIKSANPSLNCIAVINQADFRGSDNDDAIELLKECEEIVCYGMGIGYRKAFGNAASEGLGVVELKPKDKIASLEIEALDHFIYSCITSNL